MRTNIFTQPYTVPGEKVGMFITKRRHEQLMREERRRAEIADLMEKMWDLEDRIIKLEEMKEK